MSDRDDYMAYVGDCAGQAQEEVVSSWIDANREILKQVKIVLDDKDFEKVKGIIEKIGPV